MDKKDGFEKATSKAETPALKAPQIDKPRYVFRNRYGHIRAGWRILVFLGILIPVSLPFIGILKLVSLFIPAGEELGMFSLVSVLFFFFISIVLVVTSWITLKWVDRRPYKLLGLNFSRRSIREFFTGAGIALANLVPVVLILLSMGFLEVQSLSFNSAVFTGILTTLIVFFAAASLEEILNRGYLFQALCEGTRVWIAVSVFSSLFVLGHAVNENFTWNSGLFFFLHGILYSLVYLKSRSIWTAIGLHVIWNWVQGSIFGIAVSGEIIPDTVLITIPKGHNLLSGGSFGIEASLITSGISLIIIGAVWRTGWLKPAKKLAEEWQKYPSGFKLDPQEEIQA